MTLATFVRSLSREEAKMAEVDFTQNGTEAQFGDPQQGYEGMESHGHGAGDANPGDRINASKNDDDERYFHLEFPWKAFP